METKDVSYMLGHIHARLEAGELARKEIKDALEVQNEKLDTIVGYIDRQKGARRSLLAMGTAVATAAGTMAGLAVQLFTSKHG